MLRRLPRPARLGIKGAASLAILIGYPILAVNVGQTAWDIATLEPCVSGYTQIVADYKIAYDHITKTADPQVVAAAIVETEQTLERRVSELWCPLSVQDERADFLTANREFTAVMADIAQHGISDQAFFRLQLYGGAAYDAQKTFEAALYAELERQHPS